MATTKQINAERKRLGIQPISKTIATYRRMNFAGKNKSFFVDLKTEDRKLNRNIAKSIDKKKKK